MGKIIGIDLGTTNSCVTFVDNGEPVVIPNAEGSRTTPSVVAFTKDGERRVGNVAKRQAVTNPENTIFAVKRLMGIPYEAEEAERHAASVPYTVVQAMNGDAWVQVSGQEFSPPEISALILEQMKEVAEAFIGESVTQAVVTVPAYFDDAQRQATKDAAKIAGLEVSRIINEPTAAALAYGFQKEDGQRIAVYDLGGGTFDISILDIAEGVFSVKSTNGDTHLGGEDFDQVIVKHLADTFKESSGIDLSNDRIALQRLREQAEKAKHELSTSLETDVNLPFIASDDNGPKHLEITIKRSELEIMCSELVERTLGPCAQALEDAGFTASDIDEVILVGGQTRMPLVQKRVSEFFGREPNREVNPDEVVAIGAALQGGAISGEVSEVLLLDVTPLSLGVETGGGVFTRIIPRNTTIPTERSEIFTTSVDNQPFVPIHVLQGEREMASDNKTLAKFELAPIPPAMRGVPMIEVKFNIDANGMVHVSAQDKGTGQEKTVKVVASGGLTPEQLKKVISDADKYREMDEHRKDQAEARNAAEALMYTSRRAVEECAELVPSEIIQEVKVDIERLEALMETEASASSLREALQTLELSAYRIAESMYSQPEDEEEAEPTVVPTESG